MIKIPYATCDFGAIRRQHFLYIDKTPFLPRLEAVLENHVVFLRPRRFGKSTLLSLLAHYYDVLTKDQFDELFTGLWIHQHPTPNRNKYLILRLDFSTIDTEGAIEDIYRSFTTQVKASVETFAARYKHLIPKLSPLESAFDLDANDPAGLMTRLLTEVGIAGHQLYLLIDEYDHFGNRLLSDNQKAKYDQVVATTGFVKTFYTTLKAFTAASVLARTFITGIAPIMLDDLSSGFNIVVHISRDETFNAMAGFTQTEVEDTVDKLLSEHPELTQDPHFGDREALLTTLAEHYNGYLFALRATEKIYNSTLILYFMNQALRKERFPDQMLDFNVRTDYSRLYSIARFASEQDSDIRLLLEEILLHNSVSTPIVERFGTKLMLGRPQVASLLFYLGMLTFADDAFSMSLPKLVIPNRVIREMQWGYMSIALNEQQGIFIDGALLGNALQTMAVHGDIQPLLDLFQNNVMKRISNRDLIDFDEKTMKLMLFAYMSQLPVFYMASEQEVAQGYCDLLLSLKGRGSAQKFAWIVEAKYVKTGAKEATIDKAVEEGYKQIDRYAADRDVVQMLTQGHALKAGVLVFVGTKKVLWKAWPRPKKAKTAAKKTQKTGAKKAGRPS